MSARKSERLLNLVICLLVARTYVTKERIREVVEGYAGTDRRGLREDVRARQGRVARPGHPDRDGHHRQVLLRRSGLPHPPGRLRTARGQAGAGRGRGARRRRPGLAARQPGRGDQFRRAEAEGRRDPDRPVRPERDRAARRCLRARVRPALVGRRDPHGGDVRAHPQRRRREDQADPRAVGDRLLARPLVRRGPGPGPPGHPDVPAVADRRQRQDDRPARGVLRAHGDGPALPGRRARAPPPTSEAKIRARAGSCVSLRRRATAVEPYEDGWDLLHVPYADAGVLAEEIASYGPQAVVEAPGDVLDGVLRRLREVAGVPA